MIQLKNLWILLTFVFIYSCNSKNYENIKYQVPTSLQGHATIENYFAEYAKSGSVIIGVSKELMGDPSIVKMAKTSSQMSKATDKINELKALKPEIIASLNETQQRDFEKVMYALDASIGQMRTNMNAIDDSEMAAIQAKKAAQQTEIDNITQAREDAIAQMKADGTYTETNSKSNTLNMPKFMNVLFPVLVLGLFILSGYMFFRRIKNNVSEIGHTVSNAKNKMNEVDDFIKQGKAEGKTLSKEEQDGIDFLKKTINKF